MHTRRMIVGLSVVIAAATIIATGIVIGKSKTDIQQPYNKTVKVDKPGTIYGNVNPEAIPDEVAYSLLLRMIAMQDESDSQKRRAMGLAQSLKLNDEQSQALISIANDFHKQAQALDQKAQDIARLSSQYTNPDDPGMLVIQSLRNDKEKLVKNVISSLPSRLGWQGAEAIRHQINVRVKPKMKIIPVGEK